ncbi:unnamed protein product [Closterium sp. NIES-54]
MRKMRGKGPTVEVAAGAAAEPATTAAASTGAAATATAAAATTAVAAAVATTIWQASTGGGGYAGGCLSCCWCVGVSYAAVGDTAGSVGCRECAGGSGGCCWCYWWHSKLLLVRWGQPIPLMCGFGACGRGSVRLDAVGSDGGQFSAVGNGVGQSVRSDAVGSDGGQFSAVGSSEECSLQVVLFAATAGARCCSAGGALLEGACKRGEYERTGGWVRTGG